MLNQCIFIGRLKDVLVKNQQVVEITLSVDNKDEKKPTLITFDMDSPNADFVKTFQIDALVAVKATYINNEEKRQRFVVNRLSWIGGGHKGEQEIHLQDGNKIPDKGN
ncbi:MAG: hypothetical protein K9L02_03025 [Acholeplasmataceae bacterium]|nr:hypothetical protein [Acholeplasmataceae bacterium]